MIEITHTHREGTLADGTARGDGSAPILKRCGFRWGRSINCWYIPHSRDRAARRVAITKAAEELRAAGFEVEVFIEDTPRDNATTNAARHERLDARREALAAKGERLAATSEALHKASDAMIEHLPPGQPVMPGPRGRAHRNLLERSVNTAIKAAQTGDEARRMPQRIAASHRNEAYRDRPDVTARRVDRLESELRALDRKLARLPETTGSVLREQYEAERAVLVERIEGDRAVLEQARAEGRFGRWHQANVHRDDQALIRGRWRTVVRANRKTVSVATPYSWTDKYGYEEITGLRCSHTPDTDTSEETSQP